MKEIIARIIHENNRIYCQKLGDMSQVPWDEAPDWQKESVFAGIDKALEGSTPEQSHAAWCEHKRADGWVYGAVKDPEAKTHPCLVSYVELPLDQRFKDELFVTTLAAWLAGQGKAGQGKAGQGKAGQGKAGQGKARQGKARRAVVREKITASFYDTLISPEVDRRKGCPEGTNLRAFQQVENPRKELVTNMWLPGSFPGDTTFAINNIDVLLGGSVADVREAVCALGVVPIIGNKMMSVPAPHIERFEQNDGGAIAVARMSYSGEGVLRVPARGFFVVDVGLPSAVLKALTYLRVTLDGEQTRDVY